MFANKENYIIVNYHYIQEPSEDWRGIFPCSPGEFKRQVEFLQEQYKIVSVVEVFKAAREEKPGKFCALTFDDCLRGVYENAVPVLVDKKLKAVFFPITSTFNNVLPYTHKVHVVLSKLSSSELIERFNKYLVSNHPNIYKKYEIPKDRRIENKRSFDDVMTANFKETIIAVPTDVRDNFLDSVFKELKLDEKELSKKFFMSKDEVLNLKELGMEIGYHSHLHFPYNIGIKEKIEEDIRQNKEELFKLLGENLNIMSYPNGRTSDEAIDVLKNEGIDYALTIEKRGVEKGDNPYLIPRYDTNNIRDFIKDN